MMFISGIKKEELNPDLRIEIPLYHRASIAFMSGSEVYYITRKFQSNKVNVHELILSTIVPSSWHVIRKITITSIESPGIINTITTRLKELKINVHIEEALATQIGAVFTLTLIVDLTVFLHEHNYDMNDKVSEKAIEKIETELKILINPFNNKPIVDGGSIYVKELTFPESISNITSNRKLRYVDEDQFLNSSERKIKIKNGVITIRQNILDALQLNKQLGYYYAIFSDTEEKYIKILFFDPNQTVVFIDVHHDNTYGAIAKFTEIIYHDYKFNIIASYSHQQMRKETAHWFALIDISEKQTEFFSATLDALRTCRYGPPEATKKVKNVFLIEANKNEISDDTILRFGQNKKTKDGDITFIHIKKKKLLTDYLKKTKLSDQVKNLDVFIEKHHLHTTHSLKTLLTSVIREIRNDRKNKFRRILNWAIPILSAFIVLSVLLLLFPGFKKPVLSFIEHNVIEILIPISALLVLLFKDYLKNMLKKLQQRSPGK